MAIGFEDVAVKPRTSTRHIMPLQPQARDIRLPRIKPVPAQQISGNKYDLVLAVSPDAVNNYDFYDQIVRSAEEKQCKVYSPHADYQINHSLEEVLQFAVQEAIPRTRGILIHLSLINTQIQKMFEATHENNRPFLIFYSTVSNPFSDVTYQRIKEHPGYKGEIVYFSESDAIVLLKDRIDSLILDS